MRDRPRRSMAQAMTMSNFLRLASFSMASRLRPLISALGTTDAGIPVDLDHLPATALSHYGQNKWTESGLFRRDWRVPSFGVFVRGSVWRSWQCRELFGTAPRGGASHLQMP